MDKLTEFKRETVEHITNVMKLIFKIKGELSRRAMAHDRSKLRSPEIEVFELLPPRKERPPYGTKEYDDNSIKIASAVKHHYEVNRHHPGFFENGIDGMNLVDIMEMFCDWMAATKDHENDGDIYKSIEVSIKRFGVSEQLVSIFKNTAKMMGSEVDG